HLDGVCHGPGSGLFVSRFGSFIRPPDSIATEHVVHAEEGSPGRSGGHRIIVQWCVVQCPCSFSLARRAGGADDRGMASRASTISALLLGSPRALSAACNARVSGTGGAGGGGTPTAPTSPGPGIGGSPPPGNCRTDMDCQSFPAG